MPKLRTAIAILVLALTSAPCVHAMADAPAMPISETSATVKSGANRDEPARVAVGGANAAAAEPTEDAGSAERDPAAQTGPCDWDVEDLPWQERSREVVQGVSCYSFRWLDHLFGTEKDFPEERVNGIVLLGFEYREYDGFDPRVRFRVRAPLPNLSSRLDLFIGRDNEQEFVTDTTPSNRVLYNPSLARNQDNEWLLGLGHRRKDPRRGFDYSVGARVGVHPSLYAKVQYFHSEEFSSDTDLQLRQTVFWRTDEGFGTTSRATLTHLVNRRNVVQWEAIGTISEETRGVAWYAAQTWFHQRRGKDAVSLLSFVRGETDAEVPVQDYGLNLVWRRPFTRDWMFLSMGPTVTWPRRFQAEQREMSLGFLVWLEMEFGDYRY